MEVHFNKAYIRVSQPWHHWHLGQIILCCEQSRPVRCTMCSNVPGPCPIDASSNTPSSCDNPKCLPTLTNVLWEGSNSAPAENYGLASMNAWGRRNTSSVPDCVSYIVSDCFLEGHNTKAKNPGHISNFHQVWEPLGKPTFWSRWPPSTQPRAPIMSFAGHMRCPLSSWGTKRSPGYKKAE